jgi:hypothetical protein
LAFTLGYLPILCIFIATGWGPDPKQAWPIIQIWIPCTILLIIVWSYPREKEFDLKEESRPNVPMNEHEVRREADRAARQYSIGQYSRIFRNRR